MRTPITMDGITYKVGIVYDTMSRSFSLLEGPNAGEMLSGRTERDILGTKYAYSMRVEPDPAHPADYDAFFEAISAPVDSHTITMPYGQTTLTFEAMVQSGSDTFRGKMAGINHYTGLTVNFVAIAPQRTPT